MVKISRHSRSSKRQIVKQENPDVEPYHKKTKKSYSSLDKRITRKPVRDFEVLRVQTILDILPAFTKFYDKLSRDDIIAIKYYYRDGCFFNTYLLVTEQSKSINKLKLTVPFYYAEEMSLRRDLFGSTTNPELYFQPSLDIKELGKYIDSSYSTRIELLNRLDNIYSRPDCPRMKGQEILFRGMQASDIIRKLKVGDKYLFQNFISTTIDKKVAEFYTRKYGEGYPCVFILMNMKDIPFIYMPNKKLSDVNIKYSTFMKSLNLFNDLSECTLPRNLEFTIERIENKPMSAYSNKINGNFATLEKILKRKGYFNLANQKLTSAIEDNSSNDKATATTDENIKKEIDKSIFANAIHYYCTLNEWKPRTPIDWKTISSNAEFILDKNAINSWITKEDYF